MQLKVDKGPYTYELDFYGDQKKRAREFVPYVAGVIAEVYVDYYDGEAGNTNGGATLPSIKTMLSDFVCAYDDEECTIEMSPSRRLNLRKWLEQNWAEFEKRIVGGMGARMI